MLGWLSAIGDAIATFLSTISAFFSGILSVFALVAQCFNFFMNSSVVAPSVLVVFMTCTITISVVFLFIDR